MPSLDARARCCVTKGAQGQIDPAALALAERLGRLHHLVLMRPLARTAHHHQAAMVEVQHAGPMAPAGPWDQAGP